MKSWDSLSSKLYFSFLDMTFKTSFIDIFCFNKIFIRFFLDISQYWIVRILTNRASISSFHFDVSIVSPLNSPWIFYQPIITCCSNNKNSMIHFVSTPVENSIFVIWPINCINCNRHWTLLKCSIQCRTCNRFGIACHFKRTRCLFAILVFGNIWIARLWVYSFVFYVAISIFKLTSVASFISIGVWTIN